MTKSNFPFGFPFCAVTGNQPFKLALILSAINPAIGGVLVSGPRGAAKSTLARAIVDLLPAASKLVTLPLGASEEMLVASLDLQQVIKEQQVNFSPGLLAKADQGVLYVDEVNLLADPLVDLLLDVCASGINVIERDGISHQHQSRFILLGTMNPDEGELRAQLVDRFGLCVELDEKLEIAQRVKIVQLRENFDRDPQAFIDSYQSQQQLLQQQITSAKAQLAAVVCNTQLRTLIATRCVQAKVDGLRADIVWLKAAIAHAAWRGQQQVAASDIDAVAELVLSHRRQGAPSNQPPPPPKEPPPFSRPPSVESPSLSSDNSNSASDNSGEWGAMTPISQRTGQLDREVLPATPSVNHSKSPMVTRTSNKLGKIIGGQKVSGAQQAAPLSKAIDWFGTLSHAMGQWPLTALRFKPAKTGQPLVHLVLLDTSGSTLSRQQFGQAKAVVQQIASRAYQQRELLVIFGFGNQQVQQIMALQKAPKQLDNILDNVKAGGGTPLSDALTTVLDYQHSQLLAKPMLAFRNYLITDGRVSQQVTGLKLQGQTTVIDIENSAVKHGRGQEIAQQLDGGYIQLLA